MADLSVIAPPRRGKTKQGAVREWLHSVAIPFDGDECLPFPFALRPCGHGNISDRCYGVGLAHVYVAVAVHGEKPSPAHEVCHGCGVPACCNPRHLRWGTRAENMADRKVHGVLTPPPVKRGEDNNRARLNPEAVRSIRRRLLTGEIPGKIAADFGVTRGAIYSIQKGLTWTHVK